MLERALYEFVGTLVFVGVILATGQAVPIMLSLGAAIYLVGDVSGGHLNPAVSAVMLARGELDTASFAAYVASQTLGAFAALGLRALARPRVT